MALPVLVLLLLVVLLIYVLLILRPGSSWWVERELLKQGCVRAPYWHIPLYGALKHFDAGEKNMFAPPTPDERPMFTNVMGSVYVIVRPSTDSIELYEKIQDLPKNAPNYFAMDLMTFGPSILTLPDGQHGPRRRCLAKGFKNQDLMRRIISGHTTAMLDEWEKRGSRIDVLKSATRLTFGVILEHALGMRCNDNAIDSVMEDMEWLVASSWQLTKWPIITMLRMNLPGEFKSRHRKCRETFESLIATAKEQGSSDSMLRDLIEGGLSQQEILSEMMLLLFAGHDTTASGITSSVYELLRDAQLQIPLRDDGKNRYATAVFREALRLYPPVSTGTARKLSHPITIGNGKYTFPVGCVPMPMIGALHRDPVNFDSPAVFNPSRFLSATSSSEKTGARGLSAPFSLGPRNCVGQPLAMLEGPMVVAAIFERFANRITVHSDSKPHLEWVQTWKMADLYINIGE